VEYADATAQGIVECNGKGGRLRDHQIDGDMRPRRVGINVIARHQRLIIFRFFVVFWLFIIPPRIFRSHVRTLIGTEVETSPLNAKTAFVIERTAAQVRKDLSLFG
jgi:hypothetical protein